MQNVPNACSLAIAKIWKCIGWYVWKQSKLYLKNAMFMKDSGSIKNDLEMRSSGRNESPTMVVGYWSYWMLITYVYVETNKTLETHCTTFQSFANGHNNIIYNNFTAKTTVWGNSTQSTSEFHTQAICEQILSQQSYIGSLKLGNIVH